MIKKKISTWLSVALGTSIILSSTAAFAADTYTIQAGDTLVTIGEKLAIDWHQLVQINNITSPDVIEVGNVLQLPTVAPTYTQKDLNEQDVMALLWMETSAEYRELCYQAYNLAQLQVDQAIHNAKSGDKPLAIIVDCDETILDNSAYDAGHTGHNDAYANDTWGKWVNAAKAGAMPGATECLQYMASKNVEVFYVTNRDAKAGLEGTMKCLKNLGFPNVDGQHVLLQTATGNKQPRFDAIAQNYHVAVYMGDNANDLPQGTYGQSLEQRNNTVDQHKNEFGTRFIVLPNPAYGDWEGVLAANYWHLSAQQKDDARKALLKTWRVDQNN